MLILVLTRLADAVGQHRRALLRERALRQAGGAFVVAANPDHVRRAARSAVGELLGPGEPYEVLLVDPARLPPGAGERRTRLVNTTTLDPDLRERLAGCDAALVFPLSAGGGPGAEAPAAMLVAGARTTLLTTRDAIEVLAAQSALAVERIELTDSMNRRDSDEYLRAVARNATDVVLVIDDDERIRYASPSLVTVLGVPPAVRRTLHELVDPRDRYQVERAANEVRRSAEPDGVRDVWVLHRPDGSRVTVDVTYRDLRADRMVRGFVVTMHDATERHLIEERLRRQALQASPGGKNRRSSARKFD
jgi:PAS domain S-box-containing protein